LNSRTSNRKTIEYPSNGGQRNAAGDDQWMGIGGMDQWVELEFAMDTDIAERGKDVEEDLSEKRTEKVVRGGVSMGGQHSRSLGLNNNASSHSGNEICEVSSCVDVSIPQSIRNGEISRSIEKADVSHPIRSFTESEISRPIKNGSILHPIRNSAISSLQTSCDIQNQDSLNHINSSGNSLHVPNDTSFSVANRDMPRRTTNDDGSFQITNDVIPQDVGDYRTSYQARSDVHSSDLGNSPGSDSPIELPRRADDRSRFSFNEVERSFEHSILSSEDDLKNELAVQQTYLHRLASKVDPYQAVYKLKRLENINQILLRQIALNSSGEFNPELIVELVYEIERLKGVVATLEEEIGGLHLTTGCVSDGKLNAVVLPGTILAGLNNYCFM